MSVSTDVATVVAACRRGLANGSSLTGVELRLCIDTLQTLANTTESKGSAAAIALEALLVTHLAIWNAAKAGATASEYAAAVAALATPRATALTASAASVTNVTVSNILDGREA